MRCTQDGVRVLEILRVDRADNRYRHILTCVWVTGDSPVRTYRGLLFLPFRRWGYRTPADLVAVGREIIAKGLEVWLKRREQHAPSAGWPATPTCGHG
ncbi:MAG: hypothetical protein WAM94_17475 [Chromatiaceae bacterium]